MTIFSKFEMQRRAAAFSQALAERKLDAALLHTADNVFYLTGVPLLSEWGRPMWAVVKTGGPSAVIGSLIEGLSMERNATTDETIAYADEDNVVSTSIRLATDFVKKGGGSLARVGIEKQLISLGVYERLGAALPGVEFVEIGDVLGDLRIVKSPEELRILRIGGEIAKIGASAFIEAIHENCTELAVVGHAVNEMNRALAALYPEGATSTYSYAHFADHTMTPHHHATGRRLQRGDVVALNVFPVIWGYCMELERTFIFGTPTKEQQRALDSVNRAFEASKAAIGPGVRASEIDALTREMLTADGYAKNIYHGTGHAHGIMIGSAGREENGELRIYNNTVLKANMVNSVEPALFTEVGAFRHSDVMLLTEDGARCISEFQRDFVFQ
jgi:Xaa-Pro aminopeptidase